MISHPRNINPCKECSSKSLKVEYLISENIGVFTAKCTGCGNYGDFIQGGLRGTDHSVLEEQAEIVWSKDQV